MICLTPMILSACATKCESEPIVEENHKLYLLFFNAQAEDHAILWKKLLSVKEDIIYETVIEAPDLFSGKEILFEHSFEMVS